MKLSPQERGWAVEREGGPMPFRVVVCERATGIVCHPDGRRYLTMGGARQGLEFDTRAEAERYCQELCAQRHDLEYWMYESEDRPVAVFR